MKKDLNFFDFLAQIPWWVCASLSAGFYLLFQYVIPYFANQGVLVNEVHISMGPVFAPVIALALLSPISFSLLKSNRKNRLHDLRDDIKAIQKLSREEFKKMLTEAYELAGYRILEQPPFTSDPDIDLVLRKSANLYLLQSRYWLNRKIGLREVKKLFAIMHEKHASGIFLLTSGIFTRDARRFAMGRPINLVDGIELVKLSATVKKKESAALVSH